MSTSGLPPFPKLAQFERCTWVALATIAGRSLTSGLAQCAIMLEGAHRMRNEFISGDRAGSYAEYHEAVDYLPIERLSVERVSTIAENLGFVEQVPGRKGYGQAAL